MNLVRAIPLVLFAACSAMPKGAGSSASDVEAELLRTDREFCALAQRVPIGEAFRTYLAEDGTSMPQGRPFLHGRDAVAKSWSGAPAGDKLSWTPQFARAAAGGDLGYTYGTWTYTSGEGVQHGKYVTIWRRQEDGTWKAVFDGGNALDESSG
jgi:ketosteroid isomerase-like protein